MMDQPQQVREWIDKSAIQELMARYAITADTGDADGFAALFTPAAVWEWPQIGLRYEGRAALRQMVAAIDRTLPGAQHVMSNHVIDIVGDRASAICELTCFISRPAKIHVVLQGFYRDRLERVGGDWRFAHRSVDVRNPEILTTGEIGDLYKDLIRVLSEPFV